MLGPAPDETPEIDLATGTAYDEFLPIYRQLAQPTKHRRGFSPGEVDEMDLPTVAALMGIGVDRDWNDMRELADLGKRRESGDSDATWGS